MLYKWVRDLVAKYEFVTKTEFRGHRFYIFYEKDGNEKVKSLPYRTNRDKLIETIEKIKDEIDYYEKKKIKDEIVRKQLGQRESHIVFSH